MEQEKNEEMSRGQRCTVVVSLVLICLLYVLEVTSHLALTFSYFLLGHHWSGVVTLIPAVLASLLSTTLSATWYARYTTTTQDTEALQLSCHARSLNSPSKPWRWTYRTVIYLLNVSPLASYLLALRLVLQESSTCHSHAVHVRRHADFTRMFHCMYQAVPQTVLQSMLIITHPSHVELPALWLRCVCIGSSVLSATLALYFYHKNIQTRTFHKNGHHTDPSSGPHFWLRYFWHLGFLVSRMLVMTCLLTLCVMAFSSHDDQTAQHVVAVNHTTVHVNSTSGPHNSTVQVHHSAGLHYWPILALLGCILVQWLIFSCLLPRHDTSMPVHLAKAGTFVWVALSQEQPMARVFHPLHYGLDLAGLFVAVFFALMMALFFSFWSAIFAHTWVSVVFQAVSTVLVSFFSVVFGIMLFTFLFASVCKLLSFCLFSPTAQSLQLEMY